jgi:flagellar hook assembly protein FlgD
MRLVVSGDNLLPYDTSVTVASAIAEGDAVSPEMRAVAVRPAVFRQAMTVSFAPASSPGILRISNTLGLTVRNLTLRPGTATCCWDGTDESGVQAAPGVYICDLLDSHGRLLGSAKAVRTGF